MLGIIGFFAILAVVGHIDALFETKSRRRMTADVTRPSKHHLPHVDITSARWDDKANVWLATSDDVPGLVVEADTWPAMIDERRAPSFGFPARR